MQYYDVREKILSQINDPDDLLYLCSSDELSRLICSRKSFWINLFKSQELIFPDMNYTTPYEWIKELEKAKLFKLDISKLLDILKDSDALYENSKDVPFKNFYHINGIDKNSISTEWNDWLLYIFETKLRYDVFEPRMMMEYIKDDLYKITFQFFQYVGTPRGLIESSFMIDRDSMKQVFYEIMSCGIYPVDIDGVIPYQLYEIDVLRNDIV